MTSRVFVFLAGSWLGTLTACAHAGSIEKEEAREEGSEWCAAPAHGSSEAEHGVSDALLALNARFLEAHAAARSRYCQALDADRVVIRYSFGLLEARWRGQLLTPERLNVFPSEYHPVKDVSHAVLLAALLFDEPPGPQRDQRTSQAIAAVDAVLGELERADSAASRLIPAAHVPRQRRLLQQTRDALVSFQRGALGEADRKRYFAAVRGDLAENIRAIAAGLLRNLHRHVQEIRGKVQQEDAKAWDRVLVLVAAVHQARAREIGVQYFERLLAEPVGEGARTERRLVVAENVWTGPDQYGLLATHLVDQMGSVAVFDDPLRMQSDVLADHGGILESLLPGP
jgi:hypothetical protein